MLLNRIGMFGLSLALHALILLALILGYEFSQPPAVVENSANRNVINAVMLGDTPESKIIPQEPANVPPPQQLSKSTVEAVAKTVKPEVTESVKAPVQEKAIALKEAVKKPVPSKAAAEKKLKDRQAKDLLADIKIIQQEKKKINQKKLKAQFEKTLKEQSELSLRKQLLDENIHLEAKEEQPSQGEINKYKALIIQAISHHWLVPTGSDKKLSCELKIRLEPSGSVLEVVLIRSSGDSALDRSARAAVLKASPLPVPEKSVDFAPFKEFVLKVKPENVTASDSAMG